MNKLILLPANLLLFALTIQASNLILAEKIDIAKVWAAG